MNGRAKKGFIVSLIFLTLANAVGLLGCLFYLMMIATEGVKGMPNNTKVVVFSGLFSAPLALMSIIAGFILIGFYRKGRYVPFFIPLLVVLMELMPIWLPIIALQSQFKGLVDFELALSITTVIVLALLIILSFVAYIAKLRIMMRITSLIAIFAFGAMVILNIALIVDLIRRLGVFEDILGSQLAHLFPLFILEPAYVALYVSSNVIFYSTDKKAAFQDELEDDPNVLRGCLAYLSKEKSLISEQEYKEVYLTLSEDDKTQMKKLLSNKDSRKQLEKMLDNQDVKQIKNSSSSLSETSSSPSGKYQCPRCERYFNEKVERCPHCGSKFDWDN